MLLVRPLQIISTFTLVLNTKGLEPTGNLELETLVDYQDKQKYVYNSHGIHIYVYDRYIFEDISLYILVFVEMNQPMHADYRMYILFK